jgi:predicted MFS family arabinose efflux permease
MTCSSQRHLSRGLVWLMSAATGLAVAGNYYAQPLLPVISAEMKLSAAAAGVIVTTAQAGYALGLWLIVPLGDVFERRRLIVLMMLLAACGLLICALSDGFSGLLLGTAMAGVCSVVAQLLVPFAATLAPAHERGRVIGTVTSGLLLGILLARTAAGALAGIGSWHTIYWTGAACLLAMAALLATCLPSHQQSAGLSYPRLLASVLQLLRDEPVLRQRTLLGACSFASFSVLWTSIAFLLAAPPFGFSSPVIGLLGLVGAAGALAAPLIGRLGDRGQGRRATHIALWFLLLSWLVLYWARASFAALLPAVVLLDLAVQVVHISNQAEIYQLRPEARNRLASAYMTCLFIGMAAGSLASASAYEFAGWSGVVAVGLLVSVAGLLVWLRARRVTPAALCADAID